MNLKLFAKALVFCALLGLSHGQISATPEPSGSTVVAKVNGKEVTYAEVKKGLDSLPAQVQGAPIDKIYRALLDRAIDMLLITENAKKAGLDQTDDVKKKIAECQQAMLQKAYLDKEIGDLITDKVLKEKYNELIKALPKNRKQVHLRIILVSSKDAAQKLYDQVRKHSGNKKEHFMQLAKENSSDISKENGGLFPRPLTQKDMDPFFPSKAIMKTANAALVNGIHEIKDRGWALFFVDRKENVKPPEFKVIKQELSRVLQPQYAVDVIKKIRGNAKIERWGMDGKVLEDKVEAPIAPAAP